MIAGLHLIGLGLLAFGVAAGTAGAVTVGVAAIAYFRGIVHSFDFDHVSMIDNSTRKFVTEGRNPASVGLAFSAGHSTVVILTGILVIAGAGFIRTALEEESGAARILGIIGLSVSGLYLILVAIANLATFLQAWKLRKALKANPQLEIPPDALTPRGPAARIMTAPLKRVRHPRHVYVIGFLFSLGFDTSSQIGVLILTAGAALAGASAISLLCLPILFAAAMTLGDTSNGLMMLKMYTAARTAPAARSTTTCSSPVSASSPASSSASSPLSTLLTEQAGLDAGVFNAIASLDTEYAGYLLAALFAVIGISAWILWRRTSLTASRAAVTE